MIATVARSHIKGYTDAPNTVTMATQSRKRGRSDSASDTYKNYELRGSFSFHLYLFSYIPYPFTVLSLPHNFACFRHEL